MSPLDSLDEQKSIRLRRRLWGAAVFIALLVIFLPLLLDGSGSESQYRRVERLREEPPRVLDADGVVEPSVSAQDSSSQQEQAPALVENDEVEEVVSTAEITEPKVVAAPKPKPTPAPVNAEQLSAWVVQAGSFGDKANAIAVRDKLRRAGFPSFVTPTTGTKPLFRVRVGPMINLQQAEASRDKVMRLLEREAIVVSYP